MRAPACESGVHRDGHGMGQIERAQHGVAVVGAQRIPLAVGVERLGDLGVEFAGDQACQCSGIGGSDYVPADFSQRRQRRTTRPVFRRRLPARSGSLGGRCRRRRPPAVATTRGSGSYNIVANTRIKGGITGAATSRLRRASTFAMPRRRCGSSCRRCATRSRTLSVTLENPSNAPARWALSPGPRTTNSANFGHTTEPAFRHRLGLRHSARRTPSPSTSSASSLFNAATRLFPLCSPSPRPPVPPKRAPAGRQPVRL